MSILSIVAVGRLAERYVRQAGEPIRIEQLVAQLEELNIDVERARAGIRLATFVGRLTVIEDLERQPCLQLPAEEAA